MDPQRPGRETMMRRGPRRPTDDEPGPSRVRATDRNTRSSGRLVRVVASATALFVLLAIAASAPALAKRKGKGKGGGATSSKRVTIIAPQSREPADGPVRAQITKALKKKKVKVGPKSKEQP